MAWHVEMGLSSVLSKDLVLVLVFFSCLAFIVFKSQNIEVSSYY